MVCKRVITKCVSEITHTKAFKMKRTYIYYDEHYITQPTMFNSKQEHSNGAMFQAHIQRIW